MVMQQSNNRNHKRFFQCIDVSGTCSGPIQKNKQVFEGQTRDISLKGLCVRVADQKSYQTGQKANIYIKLFENEKPLLAIGDICWIENGSDPDRPINLGIRLTGMGNVRQYERWLEVISWYQTQ